MEGVIKAVQRIPVFRDRSAEKQQEAERQRLVAEIRAVCTQLRAAQARFDLLCDADLVDACIYEMEALGARYRFLLNQARAMGVTESPFAQQVG